MLEVAFNVSVASKQFRVHSILKKECSSISIVCLSNIFLGNICFTQLTWLYLFNVLFEMESNTEKFKAEAEAKILREMEEEEVLYNEVKEKKRRYLLTERKTLVNELLDLQV